MIIRTTTHFDRAYAKAPKKIQDALQKQALLLLQDLRHPSLRAKKYDEGKDLWQARVTQSWRFTSALLMTLTFCKTLSPTPRSSRL